MSSKNSLRFFPNNFSEPHLVLKIFEFLEFSTEFKLDRNRDKSKMFDFFGYFSVDRTRKIWYLFPSVKIQGNLDYDGTSNIPFCAIPKIESLCNIRYVRNVRISKTKAVVSSSIIEKIYQLSSSPGLKLKSFRADSCRFKSLEDLNKLPIQMRTLELRRCIFVCQYGGGGKRQFLSFKNTSVLPNLKVLIIERRSNKRGLAINDEFFKNHQLPSLEKLKVKGGDIKTGDYLYKSAPRLKYLSFDYCYGIEDSFINKVDKLPELEVLKIKKCSNVGDRFFQTDRTSIFPNLRRVCVVPYGVNENYRSLKGNKWHKSFLSVEKLDVSGCPDFLTGGGGETFIPTDYVKNGFMKEVSRTESIRIFKNYLEYNESVSESGTASNPYRDDSESWEYSGERTFLFNFLRMEFSYEYKGDADDVVGFDDDGDLKSEYSKIDHVLKDAKILTVVKIERLDLLSKKDKTEGHDHYLVYIKGNKAGKEKDDDVACLKFLISRNPPEKCNYGKVMFRIKLIGDFCFYGHGQREKGFGDFTISK